MVNFEIFQFEVSEVKYQQFCTFLTVGPILTTAFVEDDKYSYVAHTFWREASTPSDPKMGYMTS